MSGLKLLAAVYLIGLAVVVAGHTIAAQFYDPTNKGDALTVWSILDPMMVAAMVIVLVVAGARKCALRLDPGDQSISREYLEANFIFYYSAALMIGLIWNWVGVQWVEPNNDLLLLWMLIDSTLPLLAAATGLRLLRHK